MHSTYSNTPKATLLTLALLLGICTGQQVAGMKFVTTVWNSGATFFNYLMRPANIWKACETGDLDAVEYFLKEGIDIDAKGGRCEDWTPLHYACLLGELKIATFLIRKKANVNAKNKKNWTPLHYACLSGRQLKIVKLLVCNGAKIDAIDQGLRTPLYVACEQGHLDIVTYLLKFSRTPHYLFTLMEWFEKDNSFDKTVVKNTRTKVLKALMIHLKDWHEREHLGQFETNPRAIFENLAHAQKVDVGFTYEDEI